MDEERSPAEIGRGLLETEMGPGSSFAHLYRGEVHRMRFWRERLDRTTNWAVLVMAGVLTWSFSDPARPHYVVLVGVAAVSVFLWIEARRFRGYDIWRSRVRSLQRNVWAPGLDDERPPPNEHWRTDLASDYTQPTVKITIEESIAHRLRRVYLPLYVVLLASWIIHVTAFTDTAWPASAAIGPAPGLLVSAVVAGFFGVLTAVALRPRTWHCRDELNTVELRRDA